ncbi:hypothetical protein EN739_33875, partial [Mesorhizobium sp. M2A.F.Ca.ET.017.03.2.1]|uniref:hypothetical protein n=1 Tax=unclassified Mesorhizobium TaxID=325217 RepID=UPI000FD50C57
MDELSPDEGEDPYANDPFFKMVHDVEWNACIGRQGEGVGTRAVRNRTRPLSTKDSYGRFDGDAANWASAHLTSRGSAK